MVSRNAISALVHTAIIAPMVALILCAAGRLLGSMGDAVGAAWLGRLAVLGGLVWAIGLVLLVVALGMNAIQRRDEE